MKNNVVVALVSGAVVSLGAVSSVQAQTPLANPWEGDGDTVGIEVNVGAIGEVYSDVGSGQARNGDPDLTLDITNAGGVIPPEGIENDTVTHLSNVDYQVYVNLDGDIPEFSRFHVLVGVGNRGSYSSVLGGNIQGGTEATADTIITWDRRDPAYAGANVPQTPVLALSNSANTSGTPTLVDYAADAIHGMPSTGNTPFDVVWTIAAQP